MHRRLSKWTCLLAGVALAAGCGDHIKKPASSDFTVSGNVTQFDQGSSSPLSDAEVKAGVDRNGNGTIDGDEAATATTDEQGHYSLSMKVNAGEKVVVRFSAPGVAPFMKTVRAAPWAELPLNASLRTMKDLTCDDGEKTCAVEGNEVKLGSLADGTSGSARLFNPATETTAFPGAFDDKDGNLLLSNSFTSVSLEQNGQPVSTLSTPADLRMRIPTETWKVMKDLHPGNDKIEIPLYAFDEASGEWTRQGEGWLETSSGNVIPEAALAQIRDGSWTEGVTGSGKVGHFSYWNVDWPVDTKQCLSGVILGDDGKPAEGATVLVSGVTYTGTSKPVTVGSDGKFCADVMRSEAAGEDVDQDGITGETQKVRVRIAYGGKLYDAGTFDTPKTSATCDSGGCLDVGELKLETAKEITPKICDIKGHVKDSTGKPTGSVTVYFSDPSVPQEIHDDLCGFASLNCSIISSSSDDGSYEIKTPVLDGAQIAAFSYTTDDATKTTHMRFGTTVTDGCPAGDVDLAMTTGFDSQELTVTLSGNQISWTPAVPVNTLLVYSSSAGKWSLKSTQDSGFSGPVTFGTVPAGAEQDFPANGGAALPLTSGDSVSVYLTHEKDNVPLIGAGQATVP